MRVLGFSPRFTVTSWAVVSDGPVRGKRRKDEFSIDLDRTGHCRLRDLPAVLGSLRTPDLIAAPQHNWRRPGPRVGVARIVRTCRRRADCPEPILLKLSGVSDTLCGFPAASNDAILERFFALLPEAMQLIASDDAPITDVLAALPALALLLRAKDIRLEPDMDVSFAKV